MSRYQRRSSWKAAVGVRRHRRGGGAGLICARYAWQVEFHVRRQVDVDAFDDIRREVAGAKIISKSLAVQTGGLVAEILAYPGFRARSAVAFDFDRFFLAAIA